MVVVLAPPNDLLVYTGSNRSSIGLRMHAAGILFKNESFMWNADAATIYKLRGEEDRHKLRDLLSMLAIAGVNIDRPLTEEEKRELGVLGA